MRLLVADRLEAEYWPIEGATTAAVVCHPHPLFCGTMHSHVVFRMADACRKKGISALRFNFRGVGRSSGQHDEGRGEQDDVRDALDFLSEREPAAALWVAGFSFGAAVGGQVGVQDDRVRALLLVGAPIARWPMDFLRGSTRPKAFVSGDHDEFGPGLEAFVESLPEPRRGWFVQGTTHLFESTDLEEPLGAPRARLESALAAAVDYLCEFPRAPR